MGGIKYAYSFRQEDSAMKHGGPLGSLAKLVEEAKRCTEQRMARKFLWWTVM